MSRICLLLLFILVAMGAVEKIRYIATEQPAVTFFDPKYVRYLNLTSKRYGRGDPFYYVGLHVFSVYEFHNNVSVHFYFYEYLSNRYKRGFVEMHFKMCDLIHEDQFFGLAMRQGKFDQSCPFPAGAYDLYNMTIPIKNIPFNFPFTKGRIYCNITKARTEEPIITSYINMEIKETRTFKRNWVDTPQ